MSNFDIATAAATRPEERARQIENQILNAYEATLADLRRTYSHRHTNRDQDTPLLVVHARHRARKRQMDIALARLGTRLAKAGVR